MPYVEKYALPNFSFLAHLLSGKLVVLGVRLELFRKCDVRGICEKEVNCTANINTLQSNQHISQLIETTLEDRAERLHRLEGNFLRYHALFRQ